MELQRKASGVGFDWNDPRAVLRKIREEADEIEAALDGGDADELADETGDLLFALVNLARHVGADPGIGAARHQRQIRTPLRLYRARAGGAGAIARGRVTDGNGRVMGRGEGEGVRPSPDVVPAQRSRNVES